MNEEFHARKGSYVILMLDDDEEFLNAHKRLLNLVNLSGSNSTFHVEATTGGDEAMAILEKQEIDCVLLDYMMPGDDGVTWLQRMLALRPDLPVVLLTGAGDESVAVDAMKHGAVDYLVKGGVSLEVLEKAILNAITKAAMLRHIEEQRKQLMQAERHRVMIQSLGAACHHLAQPATVLRNALVMIKRNESLSDESHVMIAEAFKAIDKICDILQRLQTVDEYRTEPYLPGHHSHSHREDEEILQI